jgi:hypothetical protein
VPDAAAQKASEKIVRDLFKEEFTWKTPGEKNSLAKKLLDLANQSKTDPAGRFVLLRESKDLTIAAGNPLLSLDTIDTMVREFEVDALALKSAAYASLSQTVFASEDIKEMAQSMLKLADTALAAENFEAAAKLAGSASTLARRAKDIPLLSRAEAKIRDCDAWKIRSEKAKRAHDTLLKKPDDPEACFIAGQYDCAIKGDWPTGLSLLTRGSQPVLKALAQRDLAAPAEPGAQAALGDDWWEAGDKDGLLGKPESRRRAAYWYRQALSGLSGISRLKVEKRLSEVEEAVGVPAVKFPEPKGIRGPFELPDRGFIRQWLMIGPFPNTGDAGLDTDFLGGESKVVPADGVESKGSTGVRRRWAAYASSDDLIDFFRVSHLGLAPEQPNLIVYAACWLGTDSDQDLQIRLGSDDGCALWLDGQLIAKHHQHRALTIDGDTHAVKLAKGKHLLLMKVENVTGSFQFILRVTTLAGERPSGVQVWN